MKIKYVVYKEEWDQYSLLDKTKIRKFDTVESAINLKKELSENPDNKDYIYMVEVEEVE